MSPEPATSIQLPVRVLVADDAAGVRELVVLLLDLESDFAVVGEARDGVEAVEQTELVAPDLVVLDVSMPRLDGIAAIERIRTVSPASRVVVFTGNGEPSLEREALDAGADAVLTKELGAATLVENLREICRGPRGRRAVRI